MSQLKEKYKKEVVPTLMERYGYKNVMRVPRMEKVVLNIGLGSNSESTTTTLGTQYGLPAYAIPLILAAVVFLGLFIWRQKRTNYPLTDLSLFRRQNYMPCIYKRLPQKSCL